MKCRLQRTPWVLCGVLDSSWFQKIKKAVDRWVLELTRGLTKVRLYSDNSEVSPSLRLWRGGGLVHVTGRLGVRRFFPLPLECASGLDTRDWRDGATGDSLSESLSKRMRRLAGVGCSKRGPGVWRCRSIGALGAESEHLGNVRSRNGILV